MNEKKDIKQFRFEITPKKLLVWLAVLFLFVPFLVSLSQLKGVEEEVALSQMFADIKEQKVAQVEVLGDLLRVEYKDPKVFNVSRKEPTESFTEILDHAGIDPTTVNYATKDQSVWQLLLELLTTVVPLILIGVFFLYLLRQARGTQDGIFSFGKSRARLFAKGKQNITFADVGGVREAKQELEEVVDFLKHPRKYRKLGARTPKGVLLIGPSGTGKTLLARAVA